MLFEYEVVYDNGEEEAVDTGLVLGRGSDEEEQFAEAIITLRRYYGVEMIKASLSPFAPDEPLRVSKELINEIGKDVTW